MSARRNIIILIAMGISIQSVSQIGARSQQQGKIYGLWENNQFGYQMTLVLNPDGSGEFDGEVIKHAMQGNRLSVILGGTKTDYTYVLQGNSLTLSGGDLDGQVVFARNPVTGESQPVTTTSYSNTSTELLGLWSGNGEMIEFKADGNCVYLGNTFPYQVSQGHIIISSSQGNVTLGYAVKGKVLTLTANGQQVVYNKSEGSGGSTGTGGWTTGPPGKVAVDLVGQWCYLNMNTNSQTSRCITLNSDGTYTYASESSRSVNTNEFSGGTSSQGNDRGTWYVQGDRIYYQSQTSGQGSYRLEKRNHPKNVNDPMIVLDGEPYVTSTLRSPWR